MSNTLCIYHKDCIDGFTAASVVYRFAKYNGDEEGYSFLGAQYQDGSEKEVLERIKAGETKRVYIVDFSYPREVLHDMVKALPSANNILVLDHHKTARDDLAGLSFSRFDMEKCGARMAWEHFFPDLSIPKFIELVEDRDLWRWKYDSTKVVLAALSSYNFNLDLWQGFLDGNYEYLFGVGETILRYRHKLIDEAVERSNVQNFSGFKVPVVNNTCKDITSEIGHILCKDFPFAVTYRDLKDGRREYSLRSDENGLDVSVVARSHGGGGHKHAAGFIGEK